MSARASALAASLALALAGAGASGGCGRDPAAGERDSGAGSGGVAGGGLGGLPPAGGLGGGGWAGRPSYGGAGGTPEHCYPEIPEPGVPAGWVPYTDFACDRPLYRPPAESLLPPPFQWTDCGPVSGLPKGCRRLVLPGTKPTVGRDRKGWVDAEGVPWLMVGVMDDGPPVAHTILIGEADGLIRNAFVSPWRADQGVFYYSHALADGWYVVDADGSSIERSAFNSQRGAALFGRVGDLAAPRMVGLESSPSTYTYDVSRSLIGRGEAPAIRYHVHDIADLDLANPLIVISAEDDPERLPPGAPALIDDALFLGPGSLRRNVLRLYTRAGGLRDLLRPTEWTEGDLNLGTDGIDLVWTHGSEHPPGEGVYPVRDIYTSPYTEDAAKLQPRRLRSDPYQGMGLNFVVGCGFAARQGTAHTPILVRLSDGVSWILEGTETWSWGVPLAITCDEVFWSYVNAGPGDWTSPFSIARIRIADLGPGLPPD